MDSILDSIKKLLGPSAEDTSFDDDITMHINSAFSLLSELGAGPVDGFMITSNVDKWTDFLGPGKKLEMVKIYVYEKVRLIFDPPQSAAAIDSLTRDIAQYEWRINVAVDPPSQTG